MSEELEAESERSGAGPECLSEQSEAAGSRGPVEVLKGLAWGGLSLWDHVRHLLELLVATRPPNTVDHFDQFSRGIRDPKGAVRPADRLPLARKLLRLANALMGPRLAGGGEEEEEDAEEGNVLGKEERVASPLEMAECWEQMGVGLGQCELFLIEAALRSLAQEDGLREVRFWGKVFGIDKSYIVAECSLTYQEIQARLKLEAAKNLGRDLGEEEETLMEGQPVFGFGTTGRQPLEEEEEVVYKKLYKYSMPPLPVPQRPPKKMMKPERTGEGANKKVYYVCHEPGEEWVPLPNVKPEEIVAARRQHKLLQGYLNAAVDCFPPFPGLERELLRAQIARISAGTQISPIGYFQFGGADEMDEGIAEEEEDENAIAPNPYFHEVPFQDLLDPAFWVHHTPHILRIGRCSYPRTETRLGEEGGEEEEVVEERAVEAGPPLLTPLSEDVSIQMVAPWRTKGTSSLLPASGAVGVYSNLWPGAYAVARGRRWENLYLGWGLKLSVTGYSPGRAPPTAAEYAAGPEVSEATDPSPEQEAEWRQAHLPPSPPPYGAEEGPEFEGASYTEPSDDED